MSARQYWRRYVTGFVAGVATFLAGYVVTYALHGRDIEETMEPLETVLALLQAEPIGTWRVVGWLFYSAHFVDTRISAEFGPVEASTSVDLVAEGSGTLELLYVVPPVLLVLAGFGVGVSAGVERVTEGAKAGASVTTGYLLVVLVGLAVFSYDGARPDVLWALLAGVFYPLVFGAGGGALAARMTGGR